MLQTSISSVANDPQRALRQRAVRLVRKGELRKATLALREAAALAPSGQAFVRLAQLLTLQERKDEAVTALKQALYYFRQDHAHGRAQTVAGMLQKLRPEERSWRRSAA